MKELMEMYKNMDVQERGAVEILTQAIGVAQKSERHLTKKDAIQWLIYQLTEILVLFPE